MKMYMSHAHYILGIVRDRPPYIGRAIGTRRAHGAVGVLVGVLMGGIPFYRPRIKDHSSKPQKFWFEKVLENAEQCSFSTGKLNFAKIGREISLDKSSSSRALRRAKINFTRVAKPEDLEVLK